MMGTADIGSVPMGCVRSPAVTADEFIRTAAVCRELQVEVDKLLKA